MRKRPHRTFPADGRDIFVFFLCRWRSPSKGVRPTTGVDPWSIRGQPGVEQTPKNQPTLLPVGHTPGNGSETKFRRRVGKHESKRPRPLAIARARARRTRAHSHLLLPHSLSLVVLPGHQRCERPVASRVCARAAQGWRRRCRPRTPQGRRRFRGRDFWGRLPVTVRGAPDAPSLALGPVWPPPP
eukprot:gene9045-biopygen19687